MNKSNALFLLACVTLVFGCSGKPWSVRPVIEPVAYTQKLADGTHEVQLRYSVTSSGGPCPSKDWFKTRTSYSTNWIYVKSFEGVQSAGKLVVTIEAGKREQPYATTNMQGTVSFTNAIMTVRLQQPDVDRKGNVTQNYVPYYLNGTYQISKSSQ